MYVYIYLYAYGKHVPNHQPVVFIYSMFNGKIHYKWTFSIAMLEITRGHVSMSSMFRSFSPCHPTIFIISTSSFAGSVPGAVVPLRDGFKPAGHGSRNAKLLDMGWVKTYYFHRTGGTSYFWGNYKCTRFWPTVSYLDNEKSHQYAWQWFSHIFLHLITESRGTVVSDVCFPECTNYRNPIEC